MRVAHHVVAIDRDTQYIFAEQLLGDVNKAGIVGQRGDEGRGFFHQGGVMASLAVVPATFNSGVQSRVKFTAVLCQLFGRKELAEDQESEGSEIVELLFC